MAQRPKARRVLLISGGVSGTAREILEVSACEAVDYVELDPLILEVARRLLPGKPCRPAHPRDQRAIGRLFVRQTAATL